MQASKQHARHRGMTPPAAELMYIKIAQQLPEYGHEAFQTLVSRSYWAFG